MEQDKISRAMILMVCVYDNIWLPCHTDDECRFALKRNVCTGANRIWSRPLSVFADLLWFLIYAFCRSHSSCVSWSHPSCLHADHLQPNLPSSQVCHSLPGCLSFIFLALFSNLQNCHFAICHLPTCHSSPSLYLCLFCYKSFHNKSRFREPKGGSWGGGGLAKPHEQQDQEQ